MDLSWKSDFFEGYGVRFSKAGYLWAKENYRPFDWERKRRLSDRKSSLDRGAIALAVFSLVCFLERKEHDHKNRLKHHYKTQDKQKKKQKMAKVSLICVFTELKAEMRQNRPSDNNYHTKPCNSVPQRSTSSLTHHLSTAWFVSLGCLWVNLHSLL